MFVQLYPQTQRFCKRCISCCVFLIIFFSRRMINIPFIDEQQEQEIWYILIFSLINFMTNVFFGLQLNRIILFLAQIILAITWPNSFWIYALDRRYLTVPSQCEAAKVSNDLNSVNNNEATKFIHSYHIVWRTLTMGERLRRFRFWIAELIRLKARIPTSSLTNVTPLLTRW